MYLSGVIDGLIVANAALKVADKAPLFCLPSNLVLKTEQLEDILYKFAQKQSGTFDAMPVDAILYLAVQDAFPCK